MCAHVDVPADAEKNGAGVGKERNKSKHVMPIHTLLYKL